VLLHDFKMLPRTKSSDQKAKKAHAQWGRFINKKKGKKKIGAKDKKTVKTKLL
jgi:hypothetical protein